jgi:valyl-tRNA synthetase
MKIASKRVELEKSYDPARVEPRWYPFWMQRQLFRADPDSKKPPFVIAQPPPNVTGGLHMGHALTATIEDILIRWRRMAGDNALWIPGVDHAGIATQMVVERELRRQGTSRHQLGREKFVEQVWAWKEKFGSRITEQHKMLGISPDWSRERFTLDPMLSAAVREAFVRLYEDGLIYRGLRLINWCPSCRTALSDLEVEHGDERVEQLYQIAYPVEGRQRKLIVATTRPETMLGDTAVAVHPEDPRYADLIGGHALLPLLGRRLPIIGDAILVDMQFGTGAVKVTPAHDFNDFEVGQRHRLPVIRVLDDDARVNQEGGPYAGLDRYAARAKIVEDLRAQGLLVQVDDHRLSLGACQRCGTVVEPTLSEQWFVRTRPLADRAAQAVLEQRTSFIPDNWTKEFLRWMDEIRDWCISRQLWWGHRIPAWHCKSCGQILVARQDPTRCGACGGALEQDPDVLDTWFSSGLWPFSTLGWPAKTRDLEVFYPNTVMETGFDILFFWVARMMMFGLHFMGEVPFRTVFLHAMVRDEHGQKMSKSKGNVVDPLWLVLGASAEETVLEAGQQPRFAEGVPRFGADALRFTLAMMAAQGRDIQLSLARVQGYRNFVNKLWNAARFVLGNLDDQVAAELPPELPLAERWIRSRLAATVAEVETALETYRFDTAAGSIYHFVWHELCDWYLELAKLPLQQGGAAAGVTRRVLVECLDAVLRLLHPFMPFVTEELWQALPIERAAAAVMVAPFPRAAEYPRDPEAEQALEILSTAVTAIRTLRAEHELSPASKLHVVLAAPDPSVRALLDRQSPAIARLARAEPVEIASALPAARSGYRGVAGTVELELRVDAAELLRERERLARELAKVEAELAAARSKLANPKFAERAPAEVVAKHRAIAEDLSGRQAKLSRLMESLGEPAGR